MNSSFVFRLVKSTVSKMTHKEQDRSAPRASNAPDDVVSVGSANHRRSSPPIGLRRHNRSPNSVLPEGQSSTLPSHALLRPPVSNDTPIRRTNVLPTQESLIDTLYGAHQSAFANDQRFPRNAVEYHRRRRRRAYDMFPVPPYSLVDPRPELSLVLNDLESCQILYWPSEPCPTYYEAMREGRRQQPLVRL